MRALRCLIFSVIRVCCVKKAPVPRHARRQGSKCRHASTSVVKATSVQVASLCGGGQIVSCGLAELLVTNDLIRELLSLAEIGDAGPFDGADGDKYVLAAIDAVLHDEARF